MYGGSTKFEKQHVSLVPALPDRRGAVWNRVALPSPGWELELDFRVTGRDAPATGEGLALWVVRDLPSPSEMSGPLFGSVLSFRGLGVFFDSRDDDEDGNNPSISAMLSDGHQLYDKANDGWASQVAGCLANYRNTAEPVALRLELVPPAQGTGNPTLVALVRTDDTDGSAGAFEPCFSVPQIDLSPGHYYIGVSAWNDRDGDAVDILGISVKAFHSTTHSLTPPPLAGTTAEEAAADAAAEAEVHRAEDVLSAQALAMVESARERRAASERDRAEGARFHVAAEATAHVTVGGPSKLGNDTARPVSADGAAAGGRTAEAVAVGSGGGDGTLQVIALNQEYLLREVEQVVKAQADAHASLDKSLRVMGSALTSLSSAMTAHASAVRELRAHTGAGASHALTEAVASIDAELRTLKSMVRALDVPSAGDSAVAAAPGAKANPAASAADAAALQAAAEATKAGVEDVGRRVRDVQTDVRGLLHRVGQVGEQDAAVLQQCVDTAMGNAQALARVRADVTAGTSASRDALRDAMRSSREEMAASVAAVQRAARTVQEAIESAKLDRRTADAEAAARLAEGGGGGAGMVAWLALGLGGVQTVLLVALYRKSAKPDPYKLY